METRVGNSDQPTGTSGIRRLDGSDTVSAEVASMVLRIAREERARSQGDSTSTQAEGLGSSSGVAAGDASPVGKAEEFHSEIFDPMIPCERERYPIGATFSSAISRISPGIRS